MKNEIPWLSTVDCFLWQWLRISIIRVIKTTEHSITLLLNLLSHILAALKLYFKGIRVRVCWFFCTEPDLLCVFGAIHFYEQEKEKEQRKKKEQGEWWHRPQNERKKQRKKQRNKVLKKVLLWTKSRSGESLLPVL